MRSYLFLGLLLPVLSAQAQPSFTLRGQVRSSGPEGLRPLAGAQVAALPAGVLAWTDSLGYYALSFSQPVEQVIFSFPGYEADTLRWEGGAELNAVLRAPFGLDAVQIEAHAASTRIDPLAAQRTELLGSQELTKAACCNLAESFETNPSVDAVFNDALTGTRQIQLLGLAGPYTQITRESMPGIRGLATGIGLDYVPGPFLESIQISKGSGSVVNGYEALAGQINVEMRKPEASEPLFVNLYAGQGGRYEGNLALAQRLSPRLSSGLLAHGSFREQVHDTNGDGFLDMPRTRQLNLVNRWKYQGSRVEAQAGLQWVEDRRQGGQAAHYGHGQLSIEDPGDPHYGHSYGVDMDTRKREAWAKAGLLFPGKPYQSIGLQVSAGDYRQTGIFGDRIYLGEQQTAYANLIFQSLLGGNPRHSYRAGASYLYDRYGESLGALRFRRAESVPGAFAEYTYTQGTRLTLLAGLRADRHNLWGWFLTPRLFLRWTPDTKTTFRLSAGRAQRTANILAENMAAFVSSRRIIVEGDPAQPGYGFRPEVAWNYGASVSRSFRLRYRPGDLAAEYYYSDFRRQVVADLDGSPQELRFYALAGASYAHSLQVTWNQELRRRLSLRAAWKWQDVRTTYRGGLLQRPLTPGQRAFLNLEYRTRDNWHFDLTGQWTSRQRLPSTAANPEGYRLPAYAAGFFTLHAQVAKSFPFGLEVYAGGENLGNYRLAQPILSADYPYGPYFDASMVWGPIFGRMLYAGLRWTLKAQGREG